MKNYRLLKTHLLKIGKVSFQGKKLLAFTVLASLLWPAILSAQSNSTAQFLADVTVEKSQAADQLAISIQTTSNASHFQCKQFLLTLATPLANGATVTFAGDGTAPYAVYYVQGNKPYILVDYGNPGITWTAGLNLAQIQINNNGTPLHWANLLLDGGGMSVSDNINTHTLVWTPTTPDTLQEPKESGKWLHDANANVDLIKFNPDDLQRLELYRMDGTFIARFTDFELKNTPNYWQDQLQPGIYFALAQYQNQPQKQAIKFMVR